MKQAATLELFSYWDALRARLDRTFLDAAPERMRTLLASTFLIEVDARRAYPLRVVGGALGRLTANARLGASFLECWEPASHELLEAMLHAVHDDGFPVVIGARARGQGAPLPIEVLLLPLSTGPGGAPRILGGLAPAGARRRRASPSPFEIVSARAIRMRSSPQSFARTPDLQSAPAVLAAPPARAPGDYHPHLRVIDGGRSDSAQV